MCTSIVEIAAAEGMAKREDEWFPLTHAVVAYDHARHALLELFGGHRTSEEVVADVVAEVRDLAGSAGGPPPQREIEADRVLGLQVGVPDFEGEVAGVRAEVEELFDGGVAGGARDAHGDRHGVVG